MEAEAEVEVEVEAEAEVKFDVRVRISCCVVVEVVVVAVRASGSVRAVSIPVSIPSKAILAPTIPYIGLFSSVWWKRSSELEPPHHHINPPPPPPSITPSVSRFRAIPPKLVVYFTYNVSIWNSRCCFAFLYFRLQEMCAFYLILLSGGRGGCS